MALYSLLLGAGLVVASPWWLWRMATERRYRESLPERLGRVPRAVQAAVAGRAVVWVHAVSVGEVLAVERLVGELGAALAGRQGESWTIVVSTTTAGGQRVARARFGTERVFVFPLDFAFAVRGTLRALGPRMLVLVESELWPRLIDRCTQAGIPVVVVNARLSDRSFARAWRVRGLWGRLFGRVALFLPQSAETRERLLRLGVAPERVAPPGNLKYDGLLPGPNATADWIRGIAGGRRVLVAGSTLDRVRRDGRSEEEMVIGAWAKTLRADGVLLVLAPRKPERFDAVAALAAEFRAARASTQQSAAGASTEIVVLDTLGDLAAVYAISSVAFVGGSLVPRGGHNPLEAARFGVPVVMGASYENFREIVDGLQAVDAIRIVRPEQLSRTLGALLGSNGCDEGRAQGERGRRFAEAQAGATGRSVTALLTRLLPERVG